MNKLIIINADLSVNVVFLTDEAKLEDEAKKLSAIIYHDELPESKFLIWNDKLKKVEKDTNKEKETIQKVLMSLCDKKQEQAQQLILGYKATPLQIERYKDKYERAKSNEFDEETNKVIISKYEEYLEQIRNLVDLIEYFRGIVDDLINANELDKAENLIKMGENFDANTTYEKIIEMIK